MKNVKIWSLLIVQFCAFGMSYSQTTKYLSMSEIFKIMNDSKVSYNILSADQLPDTLKNRKFSEIFFPQMISYPAYPKVVVNEDKSILVTEWQFDKEANQIMEEGEKYFGEKDYNHAMEKYSQAFNMDSTLYTAQLYIGDCYLNLGLFQEALESYKKANSINPNDYRTLFFQSTAYNQLGMFDQATEKYREALVLKPRHKNILMAANAYGMILGITVKDMTFEPKSLTFKKDGKINIYTPENDNMSWLGYSFVKALWLGEDQIPGLKEEGNTSYWSTTIEKQAVLLLLDGYEKSREQADFKQNEYIEDLLKITKEGLLNEFIIYEIGSKIDPTLTLRLPESTRESIKKYITNYVLVSK